MILFLARRFFHSGSGPQSKPAIRIATAGVAVGLAVMLLSVAVVTGFQREVRNRLAGFAAHIEITDPRTFVSPEAFPIAISPEVLKEVQQQKGVERVERVAQKIGVLKTENDFSGIVLKGVEPDYSLDFIASCLVEGSVEPLKKAPSQGGTHILISRRMAAALALKVGERINCYFFGQETIKQRRYTIAGIYDTHIKTFDEAFALCPLREVQRINSWTDAQISGLEIRLSDYDLTPQVQETLKTLITQRNVLSASAVSLQENPRTASVCTWLDLLDTNVVVILVLMFLLSAVTMTSGLLILILERTSTIGTLRALGATAGTVRRTFLSFAGMIALRGIFWGYAIGLGLCLLQEKAQLVRLNPEQYYVEAVPIALQPLHALVLGLAMWLLTFLVLLIPSHLASRIEPARAIRFD